MMSKLARAILEAPAPTPEHPHINVGSDAQWPILDSPVLFVRSFYAAFYDGVMGGARDGFVEKGVRFRKLCVSGNPGIGKSSFGYYALFRALRDGRTVVYQAEKLRRDHGKQKAYLFMGSTVTSDADAIDAALDDANTLFISDSITPPFVNAFTLFVTSPRRERTWEFRKTDSAAMLYFPVLSWDEICEMREACFPDVSEADAKECYVRWGGIPRYVLAHSSEQYLLDQAIRSFVPSDLSSFANEPAASDDSKGSHRVFHVKVRGEMDVTLSILSPDFYRFHSRELASNYVARELLEWSTSQLRADMARLFTGAADVTQLAVARGHVYQELALEQLARGGRFRVRRLTSAICTAADSFLELPPTSRHVFDDVFAIDERLVHSQLEPASKSFCAVDAVLVGRLLANATISTSHKLVLRAPSRKGGPAGPSRRVTAGLAAVADALGRRTGPVPFYWIVPPAVFDAWRRPQAMYADGFKLTEEGLAVDPVGCRVEQYALCVDVAPPASAPDASSVPASLSAVPP